MKHIIQPLQASHRPVQSPRSLLLLMLLLTVSLLAAGCAESASAETGEDASATVISTSASTNENSGADGIPAAPERTAEYYGMVRRVIGNEVTLRIAEQTESTDTLTEEEKAARKAERQAMSTEERQALKEAAIVMTGEEVRILIPVGSPITSGGNGTGTEEAVSVLTERVLGDIKEGMFLKIWIAEGGSGEDIVAAYTRVLQTPQ